MRRLAIGVLFGVGLGVGGLAIAAPPRSSASVSAPADTDGGRSLAIEKLKPEVASMLSATALRLLAHMDDESARADAAARQFAQRLAEELARSGTPVDPKTIEKLAEAIAGEAGAAAMALAMTLTAALAELSYIERCDAAKDCAADPSKFGVTAAGVKKMRERLAAEKTTAGALLATQKAALAKVTKKRARLEAAFPALLRESVDGGKTR